MELFYSPTSPYARKILFVADHLGLTGQITMTFIHPLLDKTGRLPAANPLGKIPTLILDNGDIVYDSPVIAETLYQLAGASDLSFEERLKHLKMQALADGIMDAAVSSQMERGREDAEQSAYWQERWRKAIIRAVAEFEEKMIQDAADWQVGSMSMACALDYLCFRHPDLNWMTDNEKTCAWYQMVRKKAIMITTDPREGQVKS